MLRLVLRLVLLFVVVFAACKPDEAPAPAPAPPAGPAFPQPSIEVSKATGGIGDNGTDTVGSRDIGVPFTRTYLVKNVGTALLTFGPASFSRKDNCTPSVVAGPPDLPPGVVFSVVVSITPQGEGKFYCTLVMPSNDPDPLKQAFEIKIEGTGQIPSAPEFKLVAPGGANIDNHGTHDVGEKVARVAFTQSFAIQNIGQLDLTIGAVTLLTPTRCTVEVTAKPTGPLAPTGSTLLTLSITPTGAGGFRCPVRIANGDNDENPFDFAVVGATKGGASLVVLSGFEEVPPDSTHEIGTVPAQVDTELDFMNANDGDAPLLVTDVTIPLGGRTNCDAVIKTLPKTDPLPPPPAYGSSSFTVSVRPDGPGVFYFTVQVASNDSTRPTYTFSVQGTAKAYPDISVVSLSNFGSDPVGKKPVGMAFTQPYTIKNIGLANLSITAVTILDEVNCTVTVTGNPAGKSVAPSATEPLTLSVTPTAAGVFTFKVEIASDDPDSGLYIFYVSGTAAVDPCALANPTKVVLGKNIYRVPMNKGCNGQLVCAAWGHTCVGVPVLSPPSAACVAFHPGTTSKSDFNGWRQSVYCDGTAGGLGCNNETQCHDCPQCITTGIGCADSQSSLLTELYVECQ